MFYFVWGAAPDDPVQGQIREQDFVSAGLFSYPVLMAVDILLYDIASVPVDDDERQHLEAVIPPVAARVRDLQDPSRTMSASSEPGAGVIDVLDPLDVIARKIRRAATDTEADVRYDPEAKPGVSNLSLGRYLVGGLSGGVRCTYGV